MPSASPVSPAASSAATAGSRTSKSSRKAAGTWSRAAPLGRVGSRQAEHLGSDAVEEQRVALLVAALQEEDPRHQALLGSQRRLPGRVGERCQLLCDRLLGHAETGEKR